MSNLSDTVNALFDAHKVTAAEVSRRSGVSQARISEIVNSKTQNPRWETLVKIAEALKISVSAFVEEKTIIAEPAVSYRPTPIQPDEYDLLQRYRKLNPQHRANIKEMITAYECLSEGKRGEPAVCGSEVQNLRRRSTD